MTESYDPTPNHQSPGEDVFVFPASFAQQRLWFIEQFLPGSAAYTIPRAIHLTGPLDPTILEQALNVVVERHEVLRTTFISLQGEPHQVVKPSLRLEIPVVDLRSFAPEEREAEAQRLIAEEAGKPFDLSTGPLIRASLLRLADQEHILLLTMHHIISDGWSMGILIRELGMAAEALNAGRSIQLPPLPIQYADYAEWQREWLQGELLEQQLNYWREQLRDAPALLELPTDHPRPAVQTMRGATLVHELPSELLLKLHALSKAENATLFMTLLAAFQTLLHRYSGQDDILVGTPVAGRTRAELEGLIGFFVNTLVMRAQFYDNPSFRTLLSRVRETALGAFAHQDLPFEKLVEELKPERSTSHSPLFQVMFALQNAPDSPLQGSGQVGGLRIRPLHVPAAIAKFDLTLELTEVEHGLVAAFEYNADLFDAETIARLARHFQILLEAVVAQPDLPVGRLPLLGDNERRRLLDEWNATTTTYPRASTIHQLFEAQAGLLPDAVAVSFLGSQLTYRELNERANRLAHHLRSLGVGPGVYVGVCLERSLDLVVALLGILKAGGAYAPLEPDYPRERLAFMFEDIRPAVLIAQQRLLDTLPYQQPHIICLDGETDLLADYPETTPSAGAAADSPAYIMYTSGSTGQPKGIIIPHRAVVRLVKETNYAHFGPDEVFLQLAPIAFDASTLEIWGPLLNGGRLAIAPPQQLSLEELGRLLEAEGVTTLWLTAGLFHQMVEYHLEGLRPIRQLLAGGDVLAVSHVRRVLEELPGCRLINGYGPTENTTFTCCYPLADQQDLGGSVPIGRPIANTRVYILDRYGEPAPVGVPGELYAGGDGLAHGYLNRPDLTAERFVPDPFSAEPGARLYRTGDLARYRSDGTIEFLGRRDQQVKIRGFRIELGEIETALLRHPEIQEAVVVARSDLPGERTLVAYIVPTHMPGPEPAALRQFLQQSLPDYMLPAAFVPLESFPLTANGKVNRRALPAPERVASAAAYVAPRTPTENALAEIWSALLGVERVGIHDSFFDLGGHSLMATQLASRIRSIFHVELPLRQIFESPTIADLAPRVEAAIAEAQQPEDDPAELAALLEQLENMSEEEAEALLRERGLVLDEE